MPWWKSKSTDIRRNVYFRADFPDDRVEDEDGELVEFGGRAIAQKIADLLTAGGCEVSPLENMFESGWMFSAVREKQNIHMHLAEFEDDEEFVLYTAETGLALPWKLAQQIYADVLLGLDAGLKADKRFDGIVWYYNRDDLQKRRGGEATPYTAAP